MRVPLLVFALAAVVWVSAASAGAEPWPRNKPFHVGVVVDGPWSGNVDVYELTRREILALTQGEFDVRFPAEGFLVSNWTLEGTKANLDRLLDDPEIDLVIAWGLLASHSICCRVEIPKPVIAPVIIDVALQGLPFDGAASGVPNLNYVSLPDNLESEIEIFRDIVPFEKIAFLTNHALLKAIPELPLRTREMADRIGLDFEYIPVVQSAAEALASLPPDTDAVYLFPQFQLAPGEFQSLLDGLVERRRPARRCCPGSRSPRPRCGSTATARPPASAPRPSAP